VPYTFNPSYLEGRDWEGHSSRPAQAKSYGDSISKNKPIVVMHIYNPSYMGSMSRRVMA
jgi:hypothetical protein